MAAELMGLREAARYAGVSHETVRSWHAAYGLGEMREGVLFIDRQALRRIMRAKAVLRKPDAAEA